MVWGLCRRLTPDPEDAYQVIWEKALKALPRFDPNGSAKFSTWLATVAHRHLIDRHRRRKVRGEIVPADNLPSVTSGADERLQAKQRQSRLEAAIGRLPEAQRRVVVLHHLQELPLQQIAVSEDVSIGTVKSRLHRGRARLALLITGVES